MRKLWIAVIAIVVVLAIVGGVHLYATDTVTKTLDQTKQGVSIRHIAPINRLENPTRWVYRITLNAENPTSNTVKIALTIFKHHSMSSPWD